jgi:hypothetical protein
VATHAAFGDVVGDRFVTSSGWRRLASMLRRKSLCTFFLSAVLSGFASQASADPVRVTGGYIQVGSPLADLSITTAEGLRYAGEHESNSPDAIILSGMPGDIVNLSFSYANAATSFGTLDPTPTLVFARWEFDFAGGDAPIPAVAEAVASGAPASAPFTFTGSFIFFGSRADAFSNINAVGRQDLFGRGTATAIFDVERTNVGVLLPDNPLRAASIVYRFEDDQAPVPEPATILLLSGGLGVLLSRRRSRQ